MFSLKDLLEFRRKKKNIYIYIYINDFISKLVYTDIWVCIFNNIVDKYNNAYQRTIKMKPFDNKSSTYINFLMLNVMIRIYKLM